MSRFPATLLQRLRAHKGVWMLLALAVFLKVASASVCLLDGPEIVTASGNQSIAATLIASTDSSATSADDACLLGESGGCHCACAHASTLPAPGLVVAAHFVIPSVEVHPPEAAEPRILASPLRPPIA